jgi:hypothetical protein
MNRSNVNNLDQFIQEMAGKQVLVVNRNRRYVMVRYDMSDLYVPSAPAKPGKRKRIKRRPE